MRELEDKKRINRIKNSILAMICFLCLIIGYKVSAAEGKTVRVAFFPMDGYHIVNEDGTFGGMDVEYFNAISHYTTWDIQFVPCESWEDALDKLAKKEVDFVGSAQYSAERAEIYTYTDISSGYTFGVIATNSEIQTAYEDFQAMREFTFGMVKNYVREAEFFEYLHHNGIDNPNVIEYDNTADMQSALDKGEIDAFVHTFTEVKEGQRLLGRFAPRPFYYITYKGNDELMRELNQAIVDVKMNQPELETELMNQYYYDKFDKAVLLTTDEKQYLDEKKVLRVGYLDNYYPFSYEEDGEFKGLSRELIESGLSITGLEIEYVRLANRQEAKTALMNGNIDIFAYSTDRAFVLREFNLKSICDYTEVPLVIVTEKTKKTEDIKKLGTVSFLEDHANEYIDSANIELITYIDQQDCIDAVMSGEVDAILCNGYYAEHLMRTDMDYNNIQIKTVLNMYYSVSIAISNTEKNLSDILEKTIAHIDSKMINEYMLRDVTYPMASFIQFFRDNAITVVWTIVIIMGGLLAIVIHMLADSRKIQKLMYKDNKMDIWNLNYLTYWGEHKLLLEKRNKYAIAYLNLSKFRRYNIVYGWSAGEKLLNVLVEAVIPLVNPDTEICARNQGDRFVLLLAYKNEDALYERLKILQAKVDAKIKAFSGDDLKLQIGVYLIPNNEIDIRSAINCANQALEFVDSNIGNNIKIYDESLQEMITERHDREKLLDSVSFENDFVAFYQPKVDIRDNKVVGAEALVRFKDPSDGGKIKAPYFFVPYYEQNGKITKMDMFVFEAVCKMLRRRMDAGLPVVTVSCNFSRMHFVKEGFADRFEAMLKKYDISKELIEVEVTETLIMEELDQRMVKETFEELKKRDIHLSIDDFGSGYSSLGIFEQIPASVVKMDRSFFLNKDNPDRQVKIMRGIVTLSEELDAQVVCEGVETEKDVHLMEEIGSYIAQGYYYSKPIPENEFELILNEGYMRK